MFTSVETFLFTTIVKYMVWEVFVKMLNHSNFYVRCIEKVKP